MTLGSLCYIQPERHRIAYKTEYEVMKMVGTMTHLGLSFLQLFINSSLLDSLTNFLLLYVYSTAILREHLLLVNGSHIRSWWIFHHFICIAISGTTLIWPYGSAYVSMRRVLVCFNVYMAAVQIMQYRYQTARLYTLRALSQVDPMETTSDAGHLHLTTGLVLLLPFLFLGHAYQYYIGYRFAKLSLETSFSEWQIWTLSVLYFLIASGNLLTTLLTVYRKAHRRSAAAIKED